MLLFARGWWNWCDISPLLHTVVLNLDIELTAIFSSDLVNNNYNINHNDIYGAVIMA